MNAVFVIIVNNYIINYVGRSSSVVGLVPEGHRFESNSSRHVGTLGKSFTHSSQLPVALQHVNSDTVSLL